MINRSDWEMVILELDARTKGEGEIYPRYDLRAAMDEDESWQLVHRNGTPHLDAVPAVIKVRRVMPDSMTSPVLRSATSSDADSIAECVRAAYSPYIKRIGKPPGPMLGNYDEIVRDHRVFVVDGGEAIIGVLVLIKEEIGLLLDNIAVRPSRQGEGIGRRLMEHAEAEARRLGYGHLDLYTHQRMTENIALYVRHGYEEIERRVERGYPRVYMRKRL